MARLVPAWVPILVLLVATASASTRSSCSTVAPLVPNIYKRIGVWGLKVWRQKGERRIL